eukprot:m.5446 g.5446  ORF g.5446 m.5446 type:complete len:473 (-) comp3311_c0_seq1:1423-2841(-)
MSQFKCLLRIQKNNDNDNVGTHLVTTKAVQKGTLLHVEEPLVACRSENEFKDTEAADEPASDEDEWKLTNALLDQGKRGAWASEYVCTDLTSRVTEVDKAYESMRSKVIVIHGSSCAPQDVDLVYNAVRNNALSLETPILSLKYGAAFYTVGSYLNHSCAPNCLSIRLGGNLLIYAAKDIAEGEEVRHSYVPLWLLLKTRSERAKHLHFKCYCERCVKENDDTKANLEALSFPSGYASSEAGKSVAVFKLACVVSPDSVDYHERVLRAASSMFDSNIEALQQHPVSAMEVLYPYFNSLFLSSYSPRMNDAGRAARLFSYCANKLVVGITASIATEVIQRTSWIYLYILKADLKHVTVPLVIKGVQDICRNFGGMIDCFRDDLGCLGPFDVHLATPTLADIVNKIGMLGPAATSMDIRGLAFDHCGNFLCPKTETAGSSFQKCAGCRRTKYCTRKCQSQDWKRVHKLECKLLN